MYDWAPLSAVFHEVFVIASSVSALLHDELVIGWALSTLFHHGFAIGLALSTSPYVRFWLARHHAIWWGLWVVALLAPFHGGGGYWLGKNIGYYCCRASRAHGM